MQTIIGGREVFIFRRAGCGAWMAALLAGSVLLSDSARAITITGESAEANNRFVSGFPTAPVMNTHSSFIGLGYDWSGVAWSTNTVGSRYKGMGMLSPVHFLAAQHFEHDTEVTQGVRVLGQDGLVYTQTNESISNLGHGLYVQSTQGYLAYDLAVGTLTAPVTSPVNMDRLAVLDLHNSSSANTLGNYTGLSLFLYGRNTTTTGSPKVGGTALDLMTTSGGDPNQVYLQTLRTEVQLQSLDSGSPALHGWTNPNGSQELTLLGVNTSIYPQNSPTYNLISVLSTAGAMAAANAVMNPAGYALRVVGNPAQTWQGGNGSPFQQSHLARNQNWSGSSTPTDLYVLFDASVTTYRTPNVNANVNLRGLYFKSTVATGDGFSFGDSGTLTIGRGGITNYDNDRQVFTAPMALGDAQYWDGGAGGITAGAVNTSGNLLEVTGSGLNRLIGIVSGSGAIAVSGGTLELTAANIYSGKTWVHAGTLLANNVSGSATGTGDVLVALGATLAGAGTITGDTHVSGSVAPGNSIGTLSIQGDVTWNAGNAWAFELGTAAASMSTAGSGGSTQDLLQITGAGNDFLKGSGSGWSFDFAGTGDEGWYRLVTWGGTTDFASGDFAATNLASGKSGSFLIDSGTSTMYLHVIPEPASGLMLLLAAGAFAARRRLRRLPPVHRSGA